MSGCNFGTNVIEQTVLMYPLHSTYLYVLKKACTYTTCKLIQTRSEDNKKWWQIQKPLQLAYPRQHTPELMVIIMLSERREGSSSILILGLRVVHENVYHVNVS